MRAMRVERLDHVGIAGVSPKTVAAGLGSERALSHRRTLSAPGAIAAP
jgi:hypothetical protein